MDAILCGILFYFYKHTMQIIRSKAHYKRLVKEQLAVTNTKVRRWVEWDPTNCVDYEAYYETRKVSIPIPVCDWSFLVCLHEIGHISTGDRLYSYLAEYNAEKWAIKRAFSGYDIACKEYELDAKEYVKAHIDSDIRVHKLGLTDIRPYVLEWIYNPQNTFINYSW